MQIQSRTYIEYTTDEGNVITVPDDLAEFLASLGRQYAIAKLAGHNLNRVCVIKYIRSVLHCSLMEAKRLFDHYAD